MLCQRKTVEDRLPLRVAVLLPYRLINLFLMMVMQAVVFPLILGAVSFISYHFARSAAFAVC